MKKYIIKNENDEVVAETFDKKQIASIIQIEIDSNDPEVGSPSIFTVECEDVIETTIPNYESARKYLGLDKGDKNHKHDKALEALEKLFTIAEAWNKEDGFVPDWSDSRQYKWFPWFVYDKGAAGFVYSISSRSWSHTYAVLGSRLCFKTEKRATEFGKTFIELFNDVLLIR